MSWYYRTVHSSCVYCYSAISPVDGLFVDLNGGGTNWYSRPNANLLPHLQRLLCFLKIEDYTKIKKWEF